jgi:hypothetical protein
MSMFKGKKMFTRVTGMTEEGTMHTLRKQRAFRQDWLTSFRVDEQDYIEASLLQYLEQVNFSGPSILDELFIY